MVTLNCANNTQNVVKITGVVPDATGSVEITMYATQQGGFGYLNAFSIEGAPAVASEGQTLTARGVAPASEHTETASDGEKSAASTTLQAKSAIADQNQLISADAFPNPFKDDVTLKFDLKDNFAKFTVLVSDLSGRIVHRLEVENAGPGTRFQKLGLNGKTLTKGVYLIRVVGLPGQAPAPLKLVKE